MLHDVEMLQYIYKTADMGCQGIQSVMDRTKNASLKAKLQAQYQEYYALRGEALALLAARGEEPQGIGLAAKLSAGLLSTGKWMASPTDSKIAEMTMQGNQTGMNKTTKHLHDYNGTDAAVSALAQKLLATEQANAEQLKGYL